MLIWLIVFYNFYNVYRINI